MDIKEIKKIDLPFALKLPLLGGKWIPEQIHKFIQILGDNQHIFLQKMLTANWQRIQSKEENSLNWVYTFDSGSLKLSTDVWYNSDKESYYCTSKLTIDAPQWAAHLQALSAQFPDNLPRQSNGFYNHTLIAQYSFKIGSANQLNDTMAQQLSDYLSKLFHEIKYFDVIKTAADVERVLLDRPPLLQNNGSGSLKLWQPNAPFIWLVVAYYAGNPHLNAILKTICQQMPYYLEPLKFLFNHLRAKQNFQAASAADYWLSATNAEQWFQKYQRAGLLITARQYYFYPENEVFYFDFKMLDNEHIGPVTVRQGRQQPVHPSPSGDFPTNISIEFKQDVAQPAASLNTQIHDNILQFEFKNWQKSNFIGYNQLYLLPFLFRNQKVWYRLNISHIQAKNGDKYYPEIEFYLAE